ncbi:hypothetical protein GGQ84_000911 [Desulfitispora alkaliphila]
MVKLKGEDVGLIILLATMILTVIIISIMLFFPSVPGVPSIDPWWSMD